MTGQILIYKHATTLFYLEYVFQEISLTDLQKQPTRGVSRKRCSENMQQIYRKAPMPKCDFNKIALRHGCFPVSLLHIFRTPFPKNISGRLLLDLSKNQKQQNQSDVFLNFSCDFFNSFMRRAVIIQKPVQSKSMDWFLYDNSLRHERVSMRQPIYNDADFLLFAIFFGARHVDERTKLCRIVFSTNFKIIFTQKTRKSERKACFFLEVI